MKRFLLIAILLLVPALGAGIYYQGHATRRYSGDAARVVILTPEEYMGRVVGDDHGRHRVGGSLHWRIAGQLVALRPSLFATIDWRGVVCRIPTQTQYGANACSI